MAHEGELGPERRLAPFERGARRRLGVERAEQLRGERELRVEQGAVERFHGVPSGSKKAQRW